MTRSEHPHSALMSAGDTAVAVRRHLDDGQVDWVWRMLLQGRDHLAEALATQDSAAVASWSERPGSTGSLSWDTLLAALARREFDRAGRRAPDWVAVVPLPERWQPEHPFLGPDRVVASTPEWLRRWNIYVPGRDLVTA